MERKSIMGAYLETRESELAVFMFFQKKNCWVFCRQSCKQGVFCQIFASKRPQSVHKKDPLKYFLAFGQNYPIKREVMKIHECPQKEQQLTKFTMNFLHYFMCNFWYFLGGGIRQIAFSLTKKKKYIHFPKTNLHGQILLKPSWAKKYICKKNKTVLFPKKVKNQLAYSARSVMNSRDVFFPLFFKK